MKRVFEVDKKQKLDKLQAGIDKSRKGEVDKPIKELIDILNSKEDYYTTSSCSGRIALMAIPDTGKKYQTEWLFVSHSEVQENETKEIINHVKKASIEKNKTLFFRFQPFIIHVAARDVESASALLRSAKETGLKRSGITSIEGRIVLEIRGHDIIEVPIMEPSEPKTSSNGMTVTEEYVEYLINQANKKMRNNFLKIEEFTQGITEKLK